jgi:hypothetical protein
MPQAGSLSAQVSEIAANCFHTIPPFAIFGHVLTALDFQFPKQLVGQMDGICLGMQDRNFRSSFDGQLDVPFVFVQHRPEARDETEQKGTSRKDRPGADGGVSRLNGRRCDPLNAKNCTLCIRLTARRVWRTLARRPNLIGEQKAIAV